METFKCCKDKVCMKENECRMGNKKNTMISYNDYALTHFHDDVLERVCSHSHAFAYLFELRE